MPDKLISEIERIILEYGQLTSKYPDKEHLLAGENTFISCSQYDDLATAIAQFVRGKIPEKKAHLKACKMDMTQYSESCLCGADIYNRCIQDFKERLL